MANDTLKVPCNSCHNTFVARKPQLKPDVKEAIYGYTCPHCSHKVKVIIRQKPVTMGDNAPGKDTAPKPATTPAPAPQVESDPITVKVPTHKQEVNGRLTWGTFPFRKQYPLREGDNTVGRTDTELTSHLMMDDAYMSRCSINIHVTRDENGYKFELRVLRAANPITVAGKQLQAGESLFLNFDDVIALGNTKFVFKPVKQ